MEKEENRIDTCLYQYNLEQQHLAQERASREIDKFNTQNKDVLEDIMRAELYDYEVVFNINKEGKIQIIR